MHHLFQVTALHWWQVNGKHTCTLCIICSGLLNFTGGNHIMFNTLSLTGIITTTDVCWNIITNKHR